jgi:hypothetical protein
MADDKSDKKSEDIQGKDDKKTNKTFTQSEHDKAVKEQVEKITADFNEKLKGFETIASELDQYKAKEKEIEMAKLSDKEKATVKQSELEKKIEALANQNKMVLEQNEMLSQVVIRDNIVNSDPSLAQLPRVYKEQIRGKNEDEIRAKADAIINEFNNDRKNLKPKADIGVPDIKQGQSSQGLPVLNVMEQFKKRFKQAGILNNNEE